MRTFIILFILSTLFSVHGLSWASTSASNSDKDTLTPYVTYNDRYFVNSQFDSRFYGHVAAVSGEILKREPGPDGRPIFLLKLDGIGRSLWIASLSKEVGTQLGKGDLVRVLGFFDKTELEPEYIAKLTQNSEYLIGFCLYSLNSSVAPVYYHGVLEKCLKWERGELDINTIKLQSKSE